MDFESEAALRRNLTWSLDLLHQQEAERESYSARIKTLSSILKTAVKLMALLVKHQESKPVTEAGGGIPFDEVLALNEAGKKLKTLGLFAQDTA